jgi:hypothetical protein
MAVAPLSASTSAATVATAGGCNATTAIKLVLGQHLAGNTDHPVAQVLCGAFSGRHSKAMAVNLSIPSCGFSGGWAVYRLAGGAWKRVFLTNHGAFMAKAGRKVRTWNGVLASGDSECFPSSYRSRDWHWNGKRLVNGPWHKSGPPPKPLPGLVAAGSAHGPVHGSD